MSPVMKAASQPTLRFSADVLPRFSMAGDPVRTVQDAQRRRPRGDEASATPMSPTSSATPRPAAARWGQPRLSPGRRARQMARRAGPRRPSGIQVQVLPLILIEHGAHGPLDPLRHPSLSLDEFGQRFPLDLPRSPAAAEKGLVGLPHQPHSAGSTLQRPAPGGPFSFVLRTT